MARVAVGVENDAASAQAAALAALKAAGYREPKKPKEGTELEPAGASVAGVEVPPHRLRVHTRPATLGSLVIVEVLAQWQDAGARMGLLLEALEARLRAAMKEAVPLYQGRVSPDGLAVVFDGARPEWDMGPIKNSITERGRFVRYTFLGGALFFLALAGLVLAAGGVGAVSAGMAPRLAALFVVLAGFCGAPYGWIALSGGFPKSVHATFDGIHLDAGSKRERVVAWKDFEGLEAQRGQVAPGAGPYGNAFAPSPTFVLRYRAPTGRLRSVHVSSLVCDEVAGAREAAKEYAPLVRRANADAVFIAPPGCPVLVAERQLTPDELHFRKLARRFLAKGRLLPVYLARAEDAKRIEEAAARGTPSAKDLRFLAQVALGREAFEAALRLLRTSLAAAPSDPETVYLLAGTLLKLERKDDAAALLDKFLERHANAGRAHVMRAIVAMAQGQEPLALMHVSRAVESLPNDLEAHELWFDIVAKDAGPEVAAAELEAQSLSRAGRWAADVVRGRRLMAMGKRQEAEKALERARSTSENDDTNAALAEAHLAAGRLDHAIAVLKGPGPPFVPGPWSSMLLAQAYAKSGQRGRALEVLDGVPLDDDLAVWAAWREVRSRVAHG